MGYALAAVWLGPPRSGTACRRAHRQSRSLRPARQAPRAQWATAPAYTRNVSRSRAKNQRGWRANDAKSSQSRVRGQPQLETATAARPRWVRERAPLQLRQAPRDGKSEARAAAIGRSAGRAVERLEDTVLLGHGDAGTAVGHHEHEGRAVPMDGDLDRRRGGRIADGVSQQIAQDAERLDEVEPTGQGRLGEVHVGLDPPILQNSGQS